MKNYKSHLTFSKNERSGIFLLVAIIFGFLSVYFFVDFSTEKILDTGSTEIVKIQNEIDSLKLAKTKNSKPKVYPFNPNFITEYKAYTLGLSVKEYDNLKAYRAKDKWVNSVSDFKKVTGVSDSLLATISPYFKFPDWVTNPKPKKSKPNYVNSIVEKAYSEKIDLNKATKEQLQQVSGIGEALSTRIINYRNKLGGFSDEIQLHNVYGLEPIVIKKTTNLFTVKTPKEINKININTASASDIATIPGVSFQLAKEIWEFRRLRERIESLSELEKIDKLSAVKLQLIQLYLFAK
ncbi:ComEA family DNA-binding protein [Patiriisocius hiemis]|uniref:Helix-hairpin-helix domain-containing protein n=1 Tax=Patiriisocius hiemis TaxID=3075604 RepID=A0ABU2YG80_9FLAO|nr:helix-hairpin-helix domain-containing protein [Constantimarinum sp. W242]MDT0556694.1 helix-hairpin-helix domain-containing protein [Constantimarinum sp. W242]